MSFQRAKIKRTLSNAKNAWRVLLLMPVYMILAWRFLGTSCLLASTTGLPCPGCGITRAVIALIRGDINTSLFYHPLAVPASVFICLYLFFWFTREQMPHYTDKALITFVIIILATYIVRMIMMFPDEPPLNYNRLAVLPRIIFYILPG